MRRAIGIILGLFIVGSLAYVVWRNLHASDEPGGQATVDPPPVPVANSGSATPDQPDAVSAAPAVQPLEHHLVVYYFMNDVRCPSCKKIESWTHGALEEAFAEELAAGSMVWRMVNTDCEENRHFIEDYELVTKQVVLVEMDRGEQVGWVNLDKVWNLLGDEGEFKAYIVTQTRAQLDWLEQS